ncbi:hypothetical protein ACLOJK_011812 [Asimina triloba]
MDFASKYEIARTADFIRSGNFARVALQFPDELLKDATRVASALRDELRSSQHGESERLGQADVGLFVMADTTYGSCCVDEVGASHVDADCVVHYGHTCLSRRVSALSLSLCVYMSRSLLLGSNKQTVYLQNINFASIVFFGLEYSYAVGIIKDAMAAKSSILCRSNGTVHYADVMSTVMNPAADNRTQNVQIGSLNGVNADGDVLKNFDDNESLVLDNCKAMDFKTSGNCYTLGGLTWNLPQGHKMEDYLLLWIGSDNSAFANIVLTFNSCEIVRYDPEENHLVRDLSQQQRILKRRYYLVEKAKDANIVGILVGTLGVAGFRHMIQQMKELIKGSGKKAYTLVMGRPNPAKLANFPECDVFVYVSCAQTALLDSKEFLAPVITPFEAMLAFSSCDIVILIRILVIMNVYVLKEGSDENVEAQFWHVLELNPRNHKLMEISIRAKDDWGYERGSKWTGAYMMGFCDLMSSCSLEDSNKAEEARFSFLKGGYMEDVVTQVMEKEEEKERALLLPEMMEKALKRGEKHLPGLVTKTAKSGAEYFISRSYHGLDMQSENSEPCAFAIGRTGKASGYGHEMKNKEDS